MSYSLTSPVSLAKVCHVSLDLCVQTLTVMQTVWLKLRVSLFGKAAQSLAPLCNVGQAQGLFLSSSLTHKLEFSVGSISSSEEVLSQRILIGKYC